MIRIALLASLLGGCFMPSSSSCKEVGCTALFAMVTVTVVDGANQPVNGLTTSTTNLENGARVPTGTFPGDGIYVVVDDNFLGEPRAGTDAHELLFTVQDPNGGTVSAEYLISAGECDCHVEKLTGPATLVLP